MKTVKIKVELKRIEPSGMLVFTPLVKYVRGVILNGKMLTEKEIKELEEKTAADPKAPKIEYVNFLVENTDAWTSQPALNLRLTPDNEVFNDLVTGDQVEITLRKL